MREHGLSLSPDGQSPGEGNGTLWRYQGCEKMVLDANPQREGVSDCSHFRIMNVEEGAIWSQQINEVCGYPVELLSSKNKTHAVVAEECGQSATPRTQL